MVSRFRSTHAKLFTTYLLSYHKSRDESSLYLSILLRFFSFILAAGDAYPAT
ncbi:MAG: hypothetical protein ACOC01_01975 [Bacteroidales bacterium]